MATLRELAERNLAVQVTPIALTESQELSEDEISAIEDSGAGCRTRLLGVRSDESLVVQLPEDSGSEQEFEAGSEVLVIAVGARLRLAGRCRVLGQAGLRLNEAVTVPVAHLSKANQVRSAQRRSHFRVNTRDADLSATLFDPCAMKADGTITSAAQMDTQVLDISGGGMKLAARQVAGDAVDLLKEGRFGCHICLPEMNQPLMVYAHLVHVDRSRDGTFYLGLKFDFEGDRQQQRIEDQILRFINNLQRQQLVGQRGRR